MLESLELRNFTAFPGAEFDFSPGLNVFLGENGSGKSHILKVAYCITNVAVRQAAEPAAPHPTKAYFQTALARKLTAVFRPDDLGRLARRDRRGRQRCEVACRLAQPQGGLEFSFNTSSKSEVAVGNVPATWIDRLPVFLPTRELLTIYPNFVSLYETSHLPFEETWRDTCVLLGAPLARGPRERGIRELLRPLESAMGGTVELTSTGGFYLNVNQVNMEMHLVAEGLRKLAMIARLIATGSLVDKGFLFWDEPEANLNPKITKLIAPTILRLCQSGIQVFVASHSLFFIREIDILLRKGEFEGAPARFFGLHRDADAVSVQQGGSVDDIGNIDALDEELHQSDRYLQASETP
jgi:energy-coupling factor transporter ATP-binding protein EcfA2